LTAAEELLSVIWQPELDEPQRRLRDVAHELARDHFGPLAEEVDRDQRYPWENVALLVESGLAGMFVPPQYGGLGATLVATCAAMEEIAAACASTAAIQSTYVLGAFPLILAGSEEQKRRYLGALVNDGHATSFALTERDAGSDAAALQATAVRDGAGYRLRGEKWFIGNGSASRHYIVFARSGSDEDRRHITPFIVDVDADGVVIDHIEDKMGIRGTLTSNMKLDTVVGDDRIVGEPGRGLRLAMQALDVGRITVAAQALGIAIAAFEHAANRAVDRHGFGQPIIRHQGIGFRLADVAIELSAARALMYEAAGAYDAGQPVSTIGAMAKVYATEVSHRAVDAAVQVFGGAGYCKPNPVERLYRDQRVTEVYEGTSEIQRLVLSRAIERDVVASREAVGT
jgi:alkylation response protein AidB-like acyl-CoA dehydrogenase